LLKNEKIIKEFNENGFGKEIIETLNKDTYYSLSELLRWDSVMENNLATLNALLDEFGEALLLEQYSPRYRYRVPKGDKSVGYFFSFMESLKQKLDVDEYSASQTTLEQIFNGFARINDATLNQRLFKKEDMNRHFSLQAENISEVKSIDTRTKKANKIIKESELDEEE
jgi:hypothetical protein